MKPEQGQLNIFFDKDTVTTTESQQILSIVNTAIGLANIDIIKKKNESKFESLKFSYYGYLYHRNQDFANSIFESFVPYEKLENEYLFEKLHKIKSHLKESQNEPYFEEMYFLLNELYFRRHSRPRHFARRQLQGRVVAELAVNRTFENRKFNLQDFSDWLNSESKNNVSQISLASTTNSLEYEIQFLIIWGLQDYDLLKDLTLLAFDYLLAIIKKPTENNRALNSC